MVTLNIKISNSQKTIEGARLDLVDELNHIATGVKEGKLEGMGWVLELEEDGNK